MATGGGPGRAEEPTTARHLPSSLLSPTCIYPTPTWARNHTRKQTTHDLERSDEIAEPTALLPYCVDPVRLTAHPPAPPSSIVPFPEVRTPFPLPSIHSSTYRMRSLFSPPPHVSPCICSQKHGWVLLVAPFMKYHRPPAYLSFGRLVHSYTTQSRPGVDIFGI